MSSTLSRQVGQLHKKGGWLWARKDFNEPSSPWSLVQLLLQAPDWVPALTYISSILPLLYSSIVNVYVHLIPENFKAISCLDLYM